MYAAKVDGQNVKILDTRTGSIKRSIGCAGYKGPKSANVEGNMVSITCGDGRVRVFDINTGSCKRSF